MFWSQCCECCWLQANCCARPNTRRRFLTVTSESMRRNSTQWTSTSQVFAKSPALMPSNIPQTQSKHYFHFWHFQLWKGSIPNRPRSGSTTIPRVDGAGWSFSAPPLFRCLWTTCKFSWSRKWAGKTTNHYLFADDQSSCRLGVHDRTSTQLRNSLHSHSQSFRPRERNDLRWEPSLSILLSPLFQSKSKGNTNGLISTWSSLEHLNIITLPCAAY